MYHRTRGKSCRDNSRHEVFECQHTFSFEGRYSTPYRSANDAENQDLILICVRSADPVELEYQCKETQDRSDKDDGRRVHQDVREVKAEEAITLLVSCEISTYSLNGQ